VGLGHPVVLLLALAKNAREGIDVRITFGELPPE
jgi:hypothetical protein